MLRITGLNKSFDGFQAVADASLDIEKGEVVAVIGPNGAGKTTLFNLITGQLTPDSGEIWFREENITGLPAHVISRKGIGRSFQIVNVFDRLTVFENVQIAVLARRGNTLNLFRPARSMAVKETGDVLANVGLSEKRTMTSGMLSHGDRKVLEIAIALGSRPELLILDEPTAGMSPDETAATLDLMTRLSGDLGLTILFCEHDMGLVFSIANRITVMNHGATIIQGLPEDVRRNRQVQEAYLGGDVPC
ncbi:Branched-chain amino acid transport ATP-binding protein LivG (TC 3.A.1.4.1) [Olavius algarvensis associated proteobacterium Delta 3]|nr:Branched-chain amino acid transport ATP-binding protein LivG (TC 3.A.1.4.1) [Olavius algarvensis associated proteobacterium Delta 3]